MSGSIGWQWVLLAVAFAGWTVVVYELGKSVGREEGFRAGLFHRDGDTDA